MLFCFSGIRSIRESGSATLNIKFSQQAELEAVKTKVSGGGDMSLKEKVKLITELSDDISAATVSYHRLVH